MQEDVTQASQSPNVNIPSRVGPLQPNRSGTDRTGAGQAVFADVSGAVSKEIIGVLKEQNDKFQARIDALESCLLQRMDALVGQSPPAASLLPPPSLLLPSSELDQHSQLTASAVHPSPASSVNPAKVGPIQSSQASEARAHPNQPGHPSQLSLHTTTENEKKVDVTLPELPVDETGETGLVPFAFRCRPAWAKEYSASSERRIVSERQKPDTADDNNSTSNDKKLKHQISIWDYEEFASTKTMKEVMVATQMSRFIIHPSSTPSILWDLTSVLFISYDGLAIPLFLSFPVEHNTFTIVMFWATLLFWTADIVVTFFKGYYKGSLLEVRPFKIARRYLHTWLTLDVCIVGIDWVFIGLGNNPTASDEDSNQMSRLARLGKVTRAMRMIRAMRLLRVMKLRALWNDVQDAINSEYLMIFLTVIKLLIIMVMVAHIIACAWYSLGNTEDGWVSKQNFREDASVQYSYLTALHWSLAQFTPAGNELKPHTPGERFFALFVLLGGLVINALLISSITAAIAELRRLHSKANKELTLLRRYLRQRDIPWQLSSRIRKYSEFVVNLQSQQIQEKDVALLSFLSVPLKKSLAYSLYKKTLSLHQMFVQYGNRDLSAFQSICQTATHKSILAKDDVLFTAGQSATQMWFINKGKLMYQHCEDRILDETVQRKSWCCEAVLWTDWHHVGTLTAVTVCDVVGVSAEKFAEITRGHKEVEMMCGRYAKEYVRRLNDLELVELTDLHLETLNIEIP